MTWQIPLALGGPVLYWELVRATRRLWPRVLRYVYAGFLLVELVVMLLALAGELSSWGHDPSVSPPPSTPLETPGVRFIRFCWEYVGLFLQQQLVLLIIATPIVVAGAIGDEKERGTLQYLFTTELRPWEIVTGKLLGRLAVLGWIGLLGLPLFLFIAGLGGMPVGWLLLGFLQCGVIAFAFASATLFTSVWTENTRDAVVGCYAFIVVVLLVVLALLGTAGIPTWLNPFEVLQLLYTPPYRGVTAKMLAAHLLAFAGAGVACLALTIFRLRSASLKQLEGRRAKPRRWLFALRPAIRGNPVRWRERHVIGLAPLPWLRRIPTWIGMLGVFSFALVLLLSSLRAITGQGFYHALLHLDFDYLHHALGFARRSQAYYELIIMGIALAVIGSLVVLVRCAGSITEERRRRTWEDLKLTPLSWDEIVTGKMYGILGATLPYLAVYSVPMLALGLIAGAGGVVLACVFVVVALIGMFVAAAIGMGMSAGEQEWR